MENKLLKKLQYREKVVNELDCLITAANGLLRFPASPSTTSNNLRFIRDMMETRSRCINEISEIKLKLKGDN